MFVSFATVFVDYRFLSTGVASKTGQNLSMARSPGTGQALNESAVLRQIASSWVLTSQVRAPSLGIPQMSRSPLLGHVMSHCLSNALTLTTFSERPGFFRANFCSLCSLSLLSTARSGDVYVLSHELSCIAFHRPLRCALLQCF